MCECVCVSVKYVHGSLSDRESEGVFLGVFFVSTEYIHDNSEWTASLIKNGSKVRVMDRVMHGKRINHVNL